MTTFTFETSFETLEDTMFFLNLLGDNVTEYHISEGQTFVLFWNEEEEEF